MGEAADVPSSFLEAIDGLRDDYREDLGHLRDDTREDLGALEGRVMAAITSIERRIEETNRLHAQVHAVDADDLGRRFAIYDAWIEAGKIAKARQDGALGLVRYGFDLANRYWRGIVAVGGVLALLIGNVHITVEAPIR